ncbi:tetratricopeptide repeat protein [Flavobacterium sp.]|uniref:tetratricopeptide repeat protein n=1 Tax=Flavobacterium sp. TaxID=239 RepID=UPI002869FB47|nr:tetratricopeptide repeat protein [Flavobacterium sp.]
MKQLLLYSLFFLSLATFAQETEKHLPKANDEFEAKKYDDAEADYRISLSKTRKNAIASYNLGNSIYRQNQAGEAKYSYLKAIENASEKSQKHQAFHNLGNVFMKEKNYTKAVEAYKNALRNNPNDDESRYNFALAKKMLKENPPKDDKKDKKKDKKDDKKDKDKDKKDDKKDQNKEKEKDKENNKEGDKDKKDDKGNNDKQNQPKPKPGGISKERLQNLLDAVNNEEKKVQDKVNAKKIKRKPVQTEKDW